MAAPRHVGRAFSGLRSMFLLLCMTLAIVFSMHAGVAFGAATTTEPTTDTSATTDMTTMATETPTETATAESTETATETSTVAETETASATTEGAATETGATSDSTATVGSLFGQRYCEILPFVALTYTELGCDGQPKTINITMQEVYNTLGYSDCPEDLWSAITVESVDEAFGSYSSFLNGPRYWTMDNITAATTSKSGPVFNFGGLEMERRAVILVAPEMAGKEVYYKANKVQRTTVYTYNKGTEIYELTDADNNRYIMQSFTTLVNPNLTLSDLPDLAQYLELPEGWAYSSSVLDEEYQLASNGLAYVVQDNLANSYQMRT